MENINDANNNFEDADMDALLSGGDYRDDDHGEPRTRAKVRAGVGQK